MSMEVSDNTALREATINIAELYIVYVFPLFFCRVTDPRAVRSCEHQIKTLLPQPRVLLFSALSRSLVLLMKRALPSCVSSSLLSVSDRIFLFSGASILHSI